MADDVKPTRKELMRIEDRIELSERGHDTLEQKRDGLIMEFMDILDEAQDVRSDLDEKYDEAQNTINMARALDGDVAVRGAAAALKEHPELTTESRSVMGVYIPQIDSTKVRKNLDQRGYGVLGTSARIDEAATAYEDLLEQIILAAEVEALGDLRGVDLGDEHAHDALGLGGDLGVFLERGGRPPDRDVAVHRAGHVDRALGLVVLLLEVRADVLCLVEDVHELHDEAVALLFERVVAPLGEFDAVLDLHQLLAGRFDVLGHYRGLPDPAS